MVRLTSWNLSEKRPFCARGSSVSLERTHSTIWINQNSSLTEAGGVWVRNSLEVAIQRGSMAVSWAAQLWTFSDCLGDKPAMDLRNVPYRSDVLTWDPDDLAEYFRTVSLAMFCLCLMEEQTAVTLGWAKFRYFIMGKARCRTKSKTAFKWEAELNWSVKMHLEKHF